MDNVYLDILTSDFNPGSIIQLSYIIERNRDIIKACNLYIDAKDVNVLISKKHGLYIKDVHNLSNGITFADIFDCIANDLNGNTIIIHGFRHKITFINAEYAKLREKFRYEGKFCTQLYYSGNGNSNIKLGDVVNREKIDKNKIIEYTKDTYGTDDLREYDPRYNTVAMLCLINYEREKQNNTIGKWRCTFS